MEVKDLAWNETLSKRFNNSLFSRSLRGLIVGKSASCITVKIGQRFRACGATLCQTMGISFFTFGYAFPPPCTDWREISYDNAHQCAHPLRHISHESVTNRSCVTKMLIFVL